VPHPPPPPPPLPPQPPARLRSNSNPSRSRQFGAATAKTAAVLHSPTSLLNQPMLPLTAHIKCSQSPTTYVSQICRPPPPRRSVSAGARLLHRSSGVVAKDAESSVKIGEGSSAAASGRLSNGTSNKISDKKRVRDLVYSVAGADNTHQRRADLARTPVILAGARTKQHHSGSTACVPASTALHLSAMTS